MSNRPVYLIDRDGNKVARLNVAFQVGHYEGMASLTETPADLRRLFERYEEVVEGQMFGLLDEVEGEIESARIRVVFEGGEQAPVEDLQVYQSTGGISFVVRQPTKVN